MTASELRVDRRSVLGSSEPLPSLDEAGSISEGMRTSGCDSGWWEESPAADALECIWIKVLLAALPVDRDLFVAAVTRESVVSMGSVAVGDRF